MLKALYSSTGIKISGYEIHDGCIKYYATSTKKSCRCPHCNQPSYNVRSRYTRKLMDLPAAGYPVSVILDVRKFKCSNKNCIRKIFSESYTGYTQAYSRRTNRASSLLSSFLIEMSSRKGAYISGLFQIRQSPSTCLRIISNLPIPVHNDKEIIGIDDWAFRKGVSYGTIIVDAMSGDPIDLIASREEPAVTSWLINHQEIKLVTRDRASSYSKAITKALPFCEQIADRFHIVKNLSERIYEVIKRQYPVIKKEFIETQNKQLPKDKDQTIIEHCRNTTLSKNEKGSVSVTGPKKQEEPRKKELLYKRIHDLYKQGMSSRKIAAALCVNKETVLNYLKYDTCPAERIVYKNNYEAFIDIITEECGKGKKTKEIFKRIRSEGFKGEITAFYCWFGKNYPDYKQNNRQTSLCKVLAEKQKPAVLFDTLSPRKISVYVSNPEFGINNSGLPCKDYSLIQQIIQSCPILQKLKEMMISFKDLLKSKTPELLDKWMTDAISYKIPDIDSFVKGMKSDFNAVRNAIIYSWSNGFVEGNVNRLKTKKREMYGRAGFQLLRRKVVLSKMG